jgi:hypothetical protein
LIPFDLEIVLAGKPLGRKIENTFEYGLFGVSNYRCADGELSRKKSIIISAFIDCERGKLAKQQDLPSG